MSAGAYFAPAKLNLFLHVVGRRADGYHLLETVFQLIDFGDTIRVTPRRDGEIVRIDPIPGVAAEDDLTVRAARALKAASGSQRGAEIAIDKRIPMGGGLGGGSSDAATTLMALNTLWGIGMQRRELAAIGLALGADVPFFIFGRSAFGRGVGEDLVALDLPPRWYVVLTPSCTVATASIFAAPNLTRNTKLVKIQDFADGAWAFPATRFRNDLEGVAVARFPPVAEALAWMRSHDAGAQVSARMTGSGACVFAGFASEEDARVVFAARPKGLDGFVAPGLATHPLAGSVEG